MNYTVDHFISKFNAIPEEKWTTGRCLSQGRSDALGHCGSRVKLSQQGPYRLDTAEGKALLGLVPNIIGINDNVGEAHDSFGASVKTRVVTALTLVKIEQEFNSYES